LVKFYSTCAGSLIDTTGDFYPGFLFSLIFESPMINPSHGKAPDSFFHQAPSLYKVIPIHFSDATFELGTIPLELGIYENKLVTNIL